MNILITGALGQIGSSLISRLSEVKNVKKVYIIDSLRSNNINVLFKFNLKKIKIKFIKADLINKKIFNKINDRIDYVIHLASITNAEASFKIKKVLFKNNYGIFRNIVNFCIKKKAKLIHLSSTSVYSLKSELVDEKLEQLAPQSPYAEEKVLEEKYLNKNKKKIKFITLRLGTITGVSKGMRFHTAVNKFCLNAILKESIPIWGNAMKLHRPYLSLKDAVKTIIFFINKKRFDNEIYNVITANYTVEDVLGFIKKNKYKIKTKIIKSPILNQFSFKVSRKKLNQTGLKLSNSIEGDVKSTLNLLKKLY
tara:strand:- start:2783 stop:3709 length:927 start_codon:yes stop_codon:yes gene_type:complete